MDWTIPTGLIEALRTAKRVTILTGAGISAESGIPTFRDKRTGLWERYKPEDLSTPEAFRRNPQLVWDWFAFLRKEMEAANPNPAHFALTEIERRIPTFRLITQNIDGLHHRAGSQNVIELHGNVTRTKCSEENILVEQWEATNERPPRCPSCQGLLRPDIVWFGEIIAPENLQAAIAAVKSCDLFFSIGTSGIVEPAASFAYRAMDAGAVVAMINLDIISDTSRWLHKINGPAGQVLPALVESAWPNQPS